MKVLFYNLGEIFLILGMDNPAIYLWIPILVVSFLSLVKLINKGGPNGKPWIRIEKVKDNE